MGTDSVLERLVPVAGALRAAGRQAAVERLRELESEARSVRERRRRRHLAAPALLFLSLTSPREFARSRCCTSRHGWSIDLPVECAHQVLTETERLGVFYCALAGRGRWLNETLFSLLEAHARQVFLLVIQPEEVRKDLVQRLESLPHVFAVLDTHDLSAGCCSGADPDVTRRAMEELQSRHLPFGFCVTAREESQQYLMGLDFYNDCLERNARFGVVLDCLQPPPADEACHPLMPAGRAALGEHIGRMRGRLDAFIAYLPWDASGDGWCLAAPKPAPSAAPDGPMLTLLHVTPSRVPSNAGGSLGMHFFETFRIATMGRPFRGSCPVGTAVRLPRETTCA